MAPDVAASSARSRTRSSGIGTRGGPQRAPTTGEKKKRGRPRKIRPGTEARSGVDGDDDLTADAGGSTADAPADASGNVGQLHGMDVDGNTEEASFPENQIQLHANEEDMVQPGARNITQTQAYLSIFADHLASTKAHLSGSSQAHEQPPFNDFDEISDVAWTSSTHPWSRTELDAFFHALSIHSRWRPDLVAEDVSHAARSELAQGLSVAGTNVGGKSIAQVIELLDVMEQASAELAAREAFSSSSSSSTSVSGGRGTRYTHEPAMEVSDDWIVAEERMALEIIRTEEERDADAAAAFLQEANPDRRRRRYEWEDARAGKRRKSEVAGGLDALPSLGSGHLQVLDSILRATEGQRSEGEEEEQMEDPKDASQPPEAGHAEDEVDEEDAAPSRRGLGSSGDDAGVQEAEPSVHAQAVITDDMIDPALLGEEHYQAPSRRGSSPPTPALPPLAAPSAPSRAQTPPTPVSPATQSPLPTAAAVSAVDDPDQDDGVDPARLSPASRRRYQKRLYMRRKRASGSRSVNTSLSVLKPGRKKSSLSVAQDASRRGGRPKTKEKRRERTRTPAASVSRPGTPVAGEEGADGGEGEQSARLKFKGRGLKTRYKLRAAFANAGVDATWLQENGMDLFNLGSLGRLSGLASSPFNEEETATHAISPALVRFLQAAITAYVGDVAREAIVLREQERKIKERSRFWKFQEHSIPTSTVEEAIQITSIRHMNGKVASEDVGQRGVSIHGDEHEDGGDAEDEEEVQYENSHDKDDVCGRDPRMAVFYPPPSFGLSSFACLTPSLYEDRRRKFIKRQLPSSRSSSPSPMQGVLHLSPAYVVPPSRALGWEDDVMPSDTDEEALQGELNSEEAVNAVDEDAAREHERRLREAVGLIGHAEDSEGSC
ncbi:hypothetical protein CONPUDRAFT_165944 [Coniophora puteana RWD-64-598 SS2]|uniref:Uncharacterized protein n=1 Tax=Coniophora puteana (strain RWD-64-598) TaxID=741705 RepID=A0A5M3MMZ5_CONPW|nr:uncharacterized protein CONPUDRAFT_165944 [Coniophora puteana RWD-64-598 SS2]EIW80417.1 hypothetical protein CONPUDRAFT_165944 [Coniophora puteana RWD-64-598 SS2]